MAVGFGLLLQIKRERVFAEKPQYGFLKGFYMVETIDQRIDRFTQYIENHLSEISKINNEYHTIHHQRILFMAVIDALSVIVFPKAKNQIRMVNLLKDFSNWKYYDRISLPHLVQVLNLSSEPAFDQLRKFANDEQKKWIDGEIVTLDRDPTYLEIENLLPKEKRHKFLIKINNKEIFLENLQHASLFYLLRCKLIHEFRALGKLASNPEPGSITNEPYYTILSETHGSSGVEKLSWELEYPLIFYREISINCLRNITKHLHENKIDPLLKKVNGSFWIDELNM